MEKVLKNLQDRYERKEPVRLLFVCLGNICRSPAAEELMRQEVIGHNDEDRFELDSAGLYGGHAGQFPDDRMRLHARRRGYDLTHHARRVRTLDFDDFDMILAMDSSNLSRLQDMAPTVQDRDKVVMMSEFFTDAANKRYDHVPDPYYEGAEGFELVLDMLEDATHTLYNAITGNFLSVIDHTTTTIK